MKGCNANNTTQYNTILRCLHTDTHPNSLGWPGHSEWMIPHLSSSSRVLVVEIERDDEENVGVSEAVTKAMHDKKARAHNK